LPSYELGISYFKKDEVDYITLLDDQQRIGKAVIEEYIKNKAIVLDLYEKWLVNFKKMMVFYHDFLMVDFSKISDREIIQKTKELHHFYSKDVSMQGFIDGFMFYAEKRLNTLVGKFCEKRERNSVAIISVLTAPTSNSFFNEEESDLLKILTHKKNKNFTAEVKKHIEKYSWLKCSYVGYKEFTAEDVADEMRKIKKQDKNLFLNNKKKKAGLIKKWGLGEEAVAIVDLSDILIKWQDQRKQYTHTYVASKNKILKEVSKRTGVVFNLLTYLLNHELESILKGKFNIGELAKRREGVLFVHKKGNLIDIVTGKGAVNFITKISAEGKNDLEEFKGSVASVGIAKGRVKVVTSVKYLDKVKKGDILVAPMTRPEYLPGMKKAAAIITDDGGITCHAAIVSRELGIPCIIGTKIATKTLMDGDLVEVDANRGIVKRVK
jgi:phosphohistidine swiveling domain-containing protein